MILARQTRMLVIITIVLNFFSVAAFAAEDNTANFLSLSDIHFDPFVSCHGKIPCPLIMSLRKSAASEWPKILAADANEVPQYRQDTTYPLLLSALNASKKTAEQRNAKFVLVLGDSLGHDYRRFYKKYANDKNGVHYQEFVLKTLQFMNLEIKNAFPTLSVYEVVGNNDSYRNDYVSTPNGPFYSDMARLWGSLIVNNENRSMMQQQFPTAGYYAVTVQPGLRLIVLNSVLFSKHTKSKTVELAANRELDWLHKQLQIAKEMHQKVFIAMHIPIGIDVYASLRIKLFTLIELWKPNYTKRFRDELAQFAPEISAIFCGHLHSDWFQILTFNGSNEIPVTGTPSISPLFGNNPGYKIYSYSLPDFELKDFTTYYYPVNGSKTWTVEYDFNQSYQSECKNCVALTGMNLLTKKGTLSEHYKRFYALGTDDKAINTKWNPYYWCAVRQISTDDYRKCIE